MSHTNPLGQLPTDLRAIASLGQDDPGGPKQLRRPRQIIFRGLIVHQHKADPNLVGTPHNAAAM
jgi:hypothetical protein